MTDEIKSFDDYVSALDQTVPITFEDTTPTKKTPTTPSPKRGRPPKSTVSEAAPSQPKSKIPPALQNGAVEQKLFSTLKKYKSSPVFYERLKHVEIHEKMNMLELKEAEKEIKSIISLQFNRVIVEKLFCKSVDISETCMVQYLQWEHCRGIADEILSEEGMNEFADELEELSMEMSTKYQPGPLVRLIAKVVVAVGSAVQERTNAIGMKQVEIEVKDKKPKKE